MLDLKHPQWQHWFNGLPNKLTLARIAAIPFLLIFYPINIYAFKFFAALLFLAAALTDFLDGYLARKYHQETSLGSLLDPIADKMLVTAGLLVLVAENRLWAWIAVLLISRELAVNGLRLIALQKNYTLKVNSMGKVKTTLQTSALFLLMVDKPLFQIPIRPLGMATIWLALGFSLYSGYLYWKEFWSFAKDEVKRDSY